MKFSATWTKLPELNKFATANPSSGGQAALQVGDGPKEMDLIVMTEAKADPDNFTLEKHYQLKRDRMLQKMKTASASKPVSLTIDGHPVLQDEIGGTGHNTNVVFLHTTVDDGDHFQPRTLLLANAFGVQRALKSPPATTSNDFGAARDYRNFSHREIELKASRDGRTSPDNNARWLVFRPLLFQQVRLSPVQIQCR